MNSQILICVLLFQKPSLLYTHCNIANTCNTARLQIKEYGHAFNFKQSLRRPGKKKNNRPRAKLNPTFNLIPVNFTSWIR